MPTIEIVKNDLDSMLGCVYTIEQLEAFLPLAKAELKDYNEQTGEIKIELNDTNRPDLWSLEGLARQIRVKLTGSLTRYNFFEQGRQDESHRIIVSSELEGIRPYIGAFAAHGPAVTEHMLVQLIQTQEKLSENFGRSRKTLSIGIYEYDLVHFPVQYQAVDPKTTSFIPLGFDQELTLDRILEEHPKGREYAAILQGLSRYPYFVDHDDRVLSFPPIINSRRSGEIKPGEQHLFIEATGNDIHAVALGLNIFACNLADQGYEILPMITEYPYTTPLGQKVVNPYPYKQKLVCPLATFTQALGTVYSPETICRLLREYGIETILQEQNIECVLPPYRADYLHPMDLIEDFAMSLGYNEFEPIMPVDFTVGRLTIQEEFSDKVRHLLIGYGFEEIISNILISRVELADLMATPDNPLVEVANPMSLAHATLRNRILPSLLRVEAASAKSAYPHRIFEVGDVVVQQAEQIMRTETRIMAAALIAHPTTNFSDIDSYLTSLMYHLGIQYSKEPEDQPGFIPGRVGSIKVKERHIGLIGELSPHVLEAWHINLPISVFELDLTGFMAC
ncbi:phenylalanine--tRNA ligase subunit beta [bacterium]|nr:phenylalanine--tRNA ligase subunit beta [bacterium]